MSDYTNKLANELYVIRKEIKNYESREKEVREKLMECFKDRDTNEFKGDNLMVRLRRSERKGKLDIKAMEADGIPIDNYRGGPTVINTIDIVPNLG